MNLLLLLSALLSALTGVGTQTRAPQVAAAVRIASEQAVEKVANVGGQRPIASLPNLIVASAALMIAPARVLSREPIFAGRRRE